MTPTRYLLTFLAGAVTIILMVAAFNAAIDPYEVAADRWYRLRPPGYHQSTDFAIDGGVTVRINAIRRSSAPVLLLGTSRTQTGFRTLPGQVFNAGQPGASFDDVRRMLRAAAQRPDPPLLYLVELPVKLAQYTPRPSFEDGSMGPFERFLAVHTAMASSRLAWHTMLNSDRTAHDFFTSFSGEMTAARHRRIAALTLRNGRIPFAGPADPATYVPAALEEVRRICGRSGGRILFYEPPAWPGALSHPSVRSALAIRLSTYRAALARLRPLPGACSLSVLDFSAGDAGNAFRIPPDAEWRDPYHFDEEIGARLLPILVSVR